MTDTPKTVFVTKWALERGVVSLMVLSADGEGVYVKAPGSPKWGAYIGPRHYHTTREAAVSRANQMRDAKLTSLNKQVERLRGMRF